MSSETTAGEAEQGLKKTLGSGFVLPSPSAE